MKQKKIKLEANYMDFIPVKNEKFDWSADDEGKVTIFVENKGFFNAIAQKIFKKPKVSQVHLDAMGDFLWPLFDGENTVFDISKLVKAHFGEKAEPLYNRLLQYLHTLELYEFIIMKNPEE